MYWVKNTASYASLPLLCVQYPKVAIPKETPKAVENAVKRSKLEVNRILIITFPPKKIKKYTKNFKITFFKNYPTFIDVV